MGYTRRIHAGTGPQAMQRQGEGAIAPPAVKEPQSPPVAKDRRETA